MYPALEDMRKLAEDQSIKRIPLCRELYSDRFTPVEVMRILHAASRHCYLLESAGQMEVWDRSATPRVPTWSLWECLMKVLSSRLPPSWQTLA